MVALPWWLGTCQLFPGPPARPCLGFPTPQSSEGGCQGREKVHTPSLHQCLIPVVFFPFPDAEQSSSPRTGIGSDQEDSKPITLGESRAQGEHYSSFGDIGVLSSFTTRQCGAGGVLLSCPPPHPQSSLLSSLTDSTDFQESFVTSGVFSVTELIQVSRSECHPHATNPPQAAWDWQHPDCSPSQMWAAAPRSPDPSLSLQHRW